MLQSLVHLQKILNTEIGLKYSNKAVIGGLPKLLSFWENNARRDGLEAAFIEGVAVRVRSYPDLPQDKRPLAIAEILDLVKEAQAASLARQRAAKAPSAAAPAAQPPPQPKPSGPRPAEPRREPPQSPRPQQPAAPSQPRPERRPEPPRPPAPSAPTSAPASSDEVAAAPKAPAPPPQPAARQAVAPHAAPHHTAPHHRDHSQGQRRGDTSPLQVEPLDPRPRRQSGPRPLRSEEPVDPLAPLEAPLTVLRKIGPETAKEYARLGLHSIRDLLLFFPRRYDNYSRMKTINRLEYGEEISLVAAVQQVTERRFRGNRTMLKVVLADGTGMLEVTEFNPWRAKLLSPGKQIVVSGRVDQYLGRLTLVPQEWEALDHDLLHTGRIVPIYRLTEGLYQRSLRDATRQVVTFWARKQADALPEDMLVRNELMAYGEALAQIHFPDTEASLASARHRLAFDELLALQVGVLRQRRQWQAANGLALTVTDEWLSAFCASLPYTLTGAQQRALADFRADIGRAVPMNRLLQGDVGSGKTVLAAAAMAIAVQNGAQAALMAPTSILAEQHFRNIQALLSSLSLPPSAIRLLQGSTPAAEKAEIYAGLGSGEVKVVIGTHALIESPVEFARLGVAVVDEQHRFGVAQRAALRGKGGNPHLLVMTATPIPRTLALTVYGDLDLSLLDEMPPGRLPITTYILHANERERGYHFVRREIQKGRQAFLIFPLVEESDKIEAKAAVEEHERLQKEIFPEFKLGLLHGRMKPDDKDAVMQAFRAGETHILVSTSVVEVGVDVPNATVMLIEGANRFGLSQLHQFRGRVGRGEHASYCLLVSDAPNAAVDERLKAMEATQDGFVLAEKDLELRGPGDFLGTRQSGFAELRSAQLSDVKTIEKARREAQRLFEHDPDLQAPEHAGLAELVNNFWAPRPGAGDMS